MFGLNHSIWCLIMSLDQLSFIHWPHDIFPVGRKKLKHSIYMKTDFSDLISDILQYANKIKGQCTCKQLYLY